MILRDNIRVGDSPFPVRAAHRLVVDGIDDNRIFGVILDIGTGLERHTRRVLLTGQGQHGVGSHYGEGSLCLIACDISIAIEEHINSICPRVQPRKRQLVRFGSLQACVPFAIQEDIRDGLFRPVQNHITGDVLADLVFIL